MNKVDFANDLLTRQITKIVDNAIKPMSILEIKEKFNLSFPFEVKRVKDSYGAGTWKGTTTITNIFHKVNETCYTNNENTTSRQCAEVQDYILFEGNY